MKRQYWVAICILLACTLIFVSVISLSPIGVHPRLEKVIQVVAVSVALITAVVAVASTDPPKKNVKAEIELSVDERREHSKQNMTKELKDQFEGFDDPVESYRVQFRILNTSGFSLKKPTLTFRLPLDRQHPNKPSAKKEVDGADSLLYSRCSFNSNLYNSEEELRMLQFASTQVISNSNLPYWNDQDESELWIRMALNDVGLRPFSVDVSINCENADGITKKVRIIPKNLLHSGEIGYD